MSAPLESTRVNGCSFDTEPQSYIDQANAVAHILATLVRSDSDMADEIVRAGLRAIETLTFDASACLDRQYARRSDVAS